MKKIFVALIACLSLASCSKFTEIQPKGKNLLSTTDELELLLNTEFYLHQPDLIEMTGDMMYLHDNLLNLLASPTPSRKSIIYTWDESKLDKMIELSAGDDMYTALCGYVGRIANPILNQLEIATGDEAKKNHLRAEAYTLRAYAEYLMVNKFASAYDPATADETPGVPYLLEDWDISVPCEQWTVGQVYKQILADCEAAISLNALPDEAINKMRMNKACPYAVKALALMAMQRYDEAESAAKEVLAMDGSIVNFLDESHTQTVTGVFLGGSYPAIYRPKIATEEDLFMIYDLMVLICMTPECESRFEPGYCTLTKLATDRMMYDYMMGMGMSLLGVNYTYTFDTQSYWNAFGLRTTQQYLIIAECEINKGNYDEAMKYLDAIRVKRIDPAIYAPLQGAVNSKEEAILHLKQVSHGEGYFSADNFINRKRWNLLPDYREDFTRDIAGNKYTLSADSKMWNFPFPLNATSINDNLKNNCL